MVGEIVLFGLWCALVWDLGRRSKATSVEIAKLKRENFNIAAKVVKQINRIDSIEEDAKAKAIFENQLTSKTATAKIVPKAHKATFRQFAQAASQASEPQETE